MNNRLSPFYKNIALWLLISLVMIFLFNYFNTAEHAKSKASLTYSQFVDLVKGDKVKIRYPPGGGNQRGTEGGPSL